ncbi:MAG: cytochrome c oxidase subunit II [Candidatus Bathyarchaeota archaeon]|nr:cytochrome c oxidase subunit II [Candidatus Bathyarchaeota archaeon]
MSQQALPPSAVDWNNFFNLTSYIGLIAAALVIGLMVYWAINNRYRKGRPVTAWQGLGRAPAREAVTFAAISTILLFGLAVGSYRLNTYLQYPPPISESLVIDVTAFQWAFSFHYPNNVTTLDECRIPTGQPIIFNVTSSDVMHNFGLPDFKVKIDAIPGRYNILWITAPTMPDNSTMTYQIRCYELCGVGHTYMIASLIAMPPSEFNQWLNSQTSSMNMTGGS